MNLLLSRHWYAQVIRILVIAVIAWWLMGTPDLLARFGLSDEWPNTNFSKSSVDMSEIMSGGPGKDGIPAIDNPKFLPASDLNSWLGDSEPVIALIIGDKAKAYPIQILIWHEIVNRSCPVLVDTLQWHHRCLEVCYGENKKVQTI